MIDKGQIGNLTKYFAHEFLQKINNPFLDLFACCNNFKRNKWIQMQVQDGTSSESEEDVYKASDDSSASENQKSSESEVDEGEKIGKKEKRKKDVPIKDDLSSGAPVPKKKRGRQGKPKITKDEFKKTVKKIL